MFARFIFALIKKDYHIEWIYIYTYKHLEHLRNDSQPEIYLSFSLSLYIAKIRAIEQTRNFTSLAINK